MRSFCKLRGAVLAASAACLLFAVEGVAQFRGLQAASVLPPSAVELKAGREVSVVLKVVIRPSYHINSNKPGEEYLIPTQLTWNNAGVKVKSIAYPEPESVHYDFSEKPLSVFSGSITLRSTLAVADPIPPGLTELNAKLRYQACNDKSCFPPVTVDVSVPVSGK